MASILTKIYAQLSLVYIFSSDIKGNPNIPGCSFHCCIILNLEGDTIRGNTSELCEVCLLTECSGYRREGIRLYIQTLATAIYIWVSLSRLRDISSHQLFLACGPTHRHNTPG